MALKCLGLLAVLLHPCAAAEGPATPQHGPASPQHPQFLQHHDKDEAHQGITPELEPVSHDKFFKKDYPDDNRPGPYNHFGYPYPEVQDSDHYDKDYVEDRNDDGGYWKAQMDYDAIRNKLTIEKEQLRRAIAKEHEEKKELEKAVEEEKIAEAEAVAAEKVENKAEAEHAKAVEALKKLKQDIGESADQTDKEVTDLEECKKQLEAAKKALKEELELKKAREAEQAAREAKERAGEQAEIDAMKTEEQLEEELAKERKERDAAKEEYNKLLDLIKKAESDLEAAARNLAKHRHADPDGGVYEAKSGVSHQSTALASLSLVLIIAQLFLH